MPTFNHTSKVQPCNPPKTKPKYAQLKLKQDQFNPLHRDTQTSLGFAKFGQLMTFALKNAVTQSIIGKISSFGISKGYSDFTHLN